MCDISISERCSALLFERENRDGLRKPSWVSRKRKRATQEHGTKLAKPHQQILDQARTDAAYSWDIYPFISRRVAGRQNRGIDRAHIRTAFEDPNIDFANFAQSMGAYAERPITDPSDLG